ncbi:MAG: sigma-70 family RNA polymerase sigma factor [Gemmataceae bacterium]|nr:sigma-70 family RNA polymerase sigma factor [Gemmataceae bacterium]
MSQQPPTFHELLEQVRQGSEEAVRQLLEHYGKHILTVIRQKLDDDMRSVFDSTDFLQDVWASFFRGDRELTFHNPTALIRFLVRMARNKVTDQMRRLKSGQRHNIDREQSLDGSAKFIADELTAAEPGPGEQAVAREEWEQLLAGCPDYQRRILEMLVQGHTHEEIGHTLGLHEKTVRRLIERIAARCRP